MSIGGLFRFNSERKDIKNILVSGTGSFLSPLVNFLALPFVLRIYTPHDYGLWALLMSLVLIPGNISTLRYDLAVVLAEDDRQAGRVIGLSSMMVLVFGLLASLGMGFRHLWLPILPPLTEAGGEVWAVPALITVVGMVLTTRAYCTRTGAFHFNSLSLVFLAAGTNGFQILAPSMGLPGVKGLILGSLFGWGASLAIQSVGFLTRLNREVWGGVLSLNYLPLMKKYRNFPMYSVPYSFVGTLRIEGIKLLLGAYGSASLVGDFAFAQRFMNFPVTVFCGGIRPVLYQKASTASKLPEVEPFARNILVMLIFLLTPMIVAFEFLAPEVFNLLAGSGWDRSVPFARLLLIPSFLLLLTGWLDRILDVAGRQDVALKYELGFSLVVLGAFWGGLAVFQDNLLAVGLQSLVTMVYYIVLTVVIYRIAGFSRARLMMPALLGIAMTAMLLALRWSLVAVLGPYWSLLVGLVVTFGVFGIGLKRRSVRGII